MREKRGVQDSIAAAVNQQFSTGDLQQYDLHDLSATAAARNAFPFHILKDTLTLVTPNLRNLRKGKYVLFQSNIPFNFTRTCRLCSAVQR
jgi:hypothetical protein